MSRGRGTDGSPQEQEPLTAMRPNLAIFKKLFDPYEADGGILLSKVLNAVRTFCTNGNVPLPDQLEERFISVADIDSNGRLSYKEFERLMEVLPDLSIFRELFEPYEADGGVPLRKLRKLVLTLCSDRNVELHEEEQQRIIGRADRDGNKRLSYTEFVHLMMVEKAVRAVPLTKFQKVVHATVSTVVPQGATERDMTLGTETDVVDSYIDNYNCCPPPLFIVIISAVELIIFIAYIIVRKNQEIEASKLANAPVDSPLIYQPARRYEAWRFLTYMFIHDGYGHMIGNLIFQLLIGIPLEIVHKFWRVGIVYCLGVIAGSLWTSITDPWTLLCGASGGCYALIGAHFATIIMNWKDMTHEWMSGPIKFLLSAPVKLVFFSLYMSVDTGYAIYVRYFSDVESQTAFVAHFAGFLAGLLAGIPVLKNFKVFDWERKVFWVAVALFIVLCLFAICFNSAYAAYYPPTDWRACCPMPCSRYPNCN